MKTEISKCLIVDTDMGKVIGLPDGSWVLCKDFEEFPRKWEQLSEHMAFMLKEVLGGSFGSPDRKAWEEFQAYQRERKSDQSTLALSSKLE